MARENDDDARADTEVLGLGGVTPDSARDERLPRDREPKEGVGAAGEVQRTATTGAFKQSKGATGIDMGAGGDGTDIEP